MPFGLCSGESAECGHKRKRRRSVQYNLSKGSPAVTLNKTPEIKLRCAWPAVTDYDLYAIVVYTDGTTEHIATFPAEKKKMFGSDYTHPAKKSTDDGAVRHLGDVRRGAGEGEEIIEIRMNDRILAVIPVAYSAQSNGAGSFRKYRVTTQILAGEQTVSVDAHNADDDRHIYTLVPGILLNTPQGVQVRALEQYSKRGSENRPSVRVTNGEVSVVMDAGPKNAYK